MPANSVLIDPPKTHLIRAIAIYGANAGSATRDRGILLAPLVCRHDHILGMKILYPMHGLSKIPGQLRLMNHRL